MRGLFKGLSAGLIGIVPYSGTAWTVKGHLGEQLPHLTGRPHLPCDPMLLPPSLCCCAMRADPQRLRWGAGSVGVGMVAGLTGQFVAYPPDVCPSASSGARTHSRSVRCQADAGGWLNRLRAWPLLQDGGLAGLFKGFSITASGRDFVTLFDLLKEAML